MKIEFELWQLLTLAIMLSGTFAGLGKLLLWQHARHVDAALALIRQDSSQWHKLEREFLEHKADIATRFVMRDDYVRGQTVLESKLDKQFLMLKAVEVKVAALPKGEN